MKLTPRHHAVGVTTAVVAVVALLLCVRPALAHDRVEIGPFVIIIGWEKEPVIVGERNALYFEISEGDTPVEDADLDVTVSYAGETFRGNLSPAGQSGVYTMELFPTVRGQYQVLLSGALGDTQINEVLEPEEVLPGAVLQFPEPAPDTLELQAAMDELSGTLQTALLLSVAALLLGGAALVVAVFGLVRSRRQAS